MIRLALGAALALGLMTSSAMAQSPPDPVKWRALDPANTLHIETSKGRVIIEMFPEIAPAHIARIRELSSVGFYDGLQFFRVIDGFMAQTGDPENNGRGRADKPNVPAEFEFRRGPEMPFVEAARQGGDRLGFYKTMPIITQPDAIMDSTPDGKARAFPTHCAGVVSMARAGAVNGVDQVDSANSQFFITRAPYQLSLDRRYTAWGRVVFGLDAVRAIAIGEPPAAPDRMIKVRVAADLPDAERPPIYVVRTDSVDFRRMVDQRRRDRGADFSVCDIDFPARIPQQEKQETERPWWRLLIPIIP